MDRRSLHGTSRNPRRYWLLEHTHEFQAEQGQTLVRVEFKRNGRYALASLPEMLGAPVVIDTKALKEIKRIPAKKPV